MRGGQRAGGGSLAGPRASPATPRPCAAGGRRRRRPGRGPAPPGAAGRGEEGAPSAREAEGLPPGPDGPGGEGRGRGRGRSAEPPPVSGAPRPPAPGGPARAGPGGRRSGPDRTATTRAFPAAPWAAAALAAGLAAAAAPRPARAAPAPVAAVAAASPGGFLRGGGANPRRALLEEAAAEAVPGGAAAQGSHRRARAFQALLDEVAREEAEGRGATAAAGGGAEGSATKRFREASEGRRLGPAVDPEPEPHTGVMPKALWGGTWDADSDDRTAHLPLSSAPAAFGELRSRVETRDYVLNQNNRHPRPDFEALRRDDGKTLEYIAETLKLLEIEQDEDRARTESWPWEGVYSQWVKDPAIPPVLPPWEADGHEAVEVAGMNMFTGEEAGRGTYFTDPLYDKLLRQCNEFPGEKQRNVSAYDAYRLKRRYFKKLSLQTPFGLHQLRKLTYTQFWQLVAHGCVSHVKPTLDRKALWVTTADTAPGGARTEKVNLPFDPELAQHLADHRVPVTPVRELSLLEDAVIGFARLFFPILAAGSLIRVYDELEGLLSKSAGSFEVIDPREVECSFANVAGIDEVKDEVVEVVEFLRNPRKFLEMGIKTPTGVMLAGPPGTGKTLLARAICGEAEVPLINASADDFKNDFVGVGAAAVRSLFESARNAAPCVVFIDEFDSLGYRREYNSGSQDMQTINQLLTEMDGFQDNTGVVVLAATNRINVIDKALLRPGRFDRVLNMPLPNVEGRVEILKVHSRKTKLAKDVDLGAVAKAAPGFTGAQLMGLMTVSAMNALRDERSEVNMKDILSALDEVQAERTGYSLDNRTELDGGAGAEDPMMLKGLAVYHVAQALVSAALPGYATVVKLDFTPSSTAFVTYNDPPELIETQIHSKGFAENRLVVLMAARVAERLALGHQHVSAASGKDQQLAAEIAKEMVVSHGYGEHIGPVQLPQANADQSGLVDLTLQDEVLQVSQNLAKVVLHDVETLVRAAEAKAYFGLAQNWPLFERLVQQVLDERFVLGSAFYATLQAAGDDFFVFPSQALSGFGFAADGRVQYPDMTNWKDRKKMRQHRLHSYGGAAPGDDEAPRFRWPAELVVDGATDVEQVHRRGGGERLLTLSQSVPKNLRELMRGGGDGGG